MKETTESDSQQNMPSPIQVGLWVNIIMCMCAFCRKMADCTYGLHQRKCWISATEWTPQHFDSLST